MNKIFDSQLKFRQPLVCRLLEKASLANKLANAYLLTGINTADKWLVAKQLACYLNCTKPDKSTNGSCFVLSQSAPACQNCQWINSLEHPQALLVLEADAKSASGKIPVEKARALASELGKTSTYFRTMVIPEANEQLFHRASANALLKTIEEPPANCVFLLFARSEKEVLATIVSRSQVIPVLASGQEDESSLGYQNLNQEEQALFAQAKETINATFGKSGLKADKGQSQRITQAVTYLNFAAVLKDLVTKEVEPDLIVDLVVKEEMAVFQKQSQVSPAICLYLEQLLALSEETKAQIDHYVTVKAAMESFSLGITKLRRKYRVA
jgi:hypothetical protein